MTDKAVRAPVSLGDMDVEGFQIVQLSRGDGFICVADFFLFFRERLPFEGVLIRW